MKNYEVDYKEEDMQSCPGCKHYNAPEDTGYCVDCVHNAVEK